VTSRPIESVPNDDPRLQALARLLGIVDRLREPDGCPWDLEQTLESMAPHLLEEAYELVDALTTGDAETVGEIGDLLMNMCLLARIGQDEKRFSMADIATATSDKLVRRHPHVFGEDTAADSKEALRRWEAVKRTERKGDRDKSALSGVPRDLPALLRAYRVGEKASRAGFDWPDAAGPLDKIDEELAELRSEIEDGTTPRRAQELGDVLFSLVNLARHLGIDAETALRRTIDRFAQRFRLVEEELGDRLSSATLPELETAWQNAKAVSENRRISDDQPTLS
jgi:MazG family protein